jgi:hypothetical protein
MINFPAVLFKAGNYANLGRGNYSINDLNEIVSNTHNKIPITIKHFDTEDVIDLGFGKDLKVINNYIEGILEFPKNIIELLKTRNLSVEINKPEKRISRITITNHPVIDEAKFSNDIDIFSFDIQGEIMIEEISEVEEISEEVEEIQENKTEEPVEIENKTEEVLEVQDDFSIDVEKENLKSELEELKLQLNKEKENSEKIFRELQNEKIQLFSNDLISKGVPANLSKLLAPYIVNADIDKFSDEYREFSNVAKEVINFMTGTVNYKKLLPENENDEIRFSTDPISIVTSKCNKNNIEIGSNEFKRLLAIELAKNV